MVCIHVERTIAAPPEHVFAWLSDPANLRAALLMLKAGWRTAATGPAVGAVREATAVGIWVREEITAYDPPRSYSYLILRAVPPINHQGGTLTFTPVPAGTHVAWESTYTHPGWIGGRAAEALSSRALRQGFVEILAGCAEQLEK